MATIQSCYRYYFQFECGISDVDSTLIVFIYDDEGGQYYRGQVVSVSMFGSKS